MNVLITGAAGQLGQALVRTAPEGSQVVAFGSAELDITDAASIADAVERTEPDVIFNAAAYTAVDRAEADEGRAFAVNALAVSNLARLSVLANARLVHVSTDFVFDGSSGTPYGPTDPTAPLGAYGRSKLAGEDAAGNNALVVRTSWVYSSDGANFVRTMLRILAERDEVRVVADQVGTPTWATSLASGLWDLALAGSRGTYHFTDSGVASWYDFAVAIAEEARTCGILRNTVRIVPIATSEYPTPARRPAYSVLDKSATWQLLGGPAPHWRENLRRMLKELKLNG